ncbi:MAG: DUF3168 domain-containing protein [Sphingomonadales bacterium]|nr:DUF3168 domain-containing protein [Sphingomonadales bacterium]
MTTDASWPLQRSVHGALATCEALQPFLGDPPRILLRPCKETAFPHVTFGDSRSKTWSSATFDGQEHEMVLDIWSDQDAAADVKQIAAIVIERLHNADLPIPGHALVDLQFESSETRLWQEKRLEHCRLEFSALTVSD